MEIEERVEWFTFEDLRQGLERHEEYQLTYKDLKQGLARNEEYEFDYHGETYSFSCNTGWY